MRHDYTLPAEWNAMSDEERCRWLTQERCRRQAMNQQTATTDALERTTSRLVRTLNARGYEPLAQQR
jgi:hypothetical protein